MRDLGRELLEATLTVGNFGVEQSLMVTVERVAIQVFVGAISRGNSSASQDIFDAPAKAGTFFLGGVQSLLDRAQYGVCARPIRFGVSIGRARPKAAIAEIPDVVVHAGSQKQLKHLGVSESKAVVVTTASDHQIMAKKCKSRGAAAHVFVNDRDGRLKVLES